MDNSFINKEDMMLSRELKPLLTTFEKAKEWEWSDLLRWLKSVKNLLDHHKSESLPEKFTLAKRLQQCLNPNLPQGLHLITLSIYESILEERQFIDTISFFSAGFLPFFEYASSENQKAVVRLAKHFLYVNTTVSIKPAYIGIVTPLLPGLEDGTSNQDVVREVMNLFDNLAERDFLGLYEAVWSALLKTDRAKLGALNYLARKMTKENIENCMPDKVLVTNALISGIYSENILVQRATMDLLNSHFPLLKNDGFLSTEEKRAILDSLFRLFKRNDSTLTRRIWDYCQTGEQLASDEDFEIIKDEYIVPTLKEIFTAEISLTRLNSQERTQKMLEPLIITETLLEKENLGVFLLKDIAVSLIGFVESYKGDQEYGKIICEKFSGLLRAEIIVNYEKQICEALAYSLEESCIGEVDYILNIIHFYLTNFPLEASKSSQLLIPIIEILFTNIHRMQNSISLAFKIANLILKKIDIRLEIQDSFTCFNRFYIEFTKNPESSLKDIKEATHIAIELTKNGNLDLGWLTCIIEFIKNPQSIELSLIGIDTAIVLIQNNLDDCKSFISQELGGLDVKLFDFLWKFLDQKSKTKKIVKLIWKLQESTSFLRLNIKDKLIISSKNGPKEVPARIFTLKRLGVLWEITRKTDNDRLLHFLTNELIFLILDKLEDPHPSVRHAARDFMSKITPELSLIIDPLFESILNQCVYKIAPISYSFRKFKLLLSACGNFVYKKMDRMTVSSSIMDQWLEYRRNIVNAEEVESCIDLLTEICVNYLIAQIYNYKEREYQIAAGELIELILNYGSREQAYRSVFRILRSLKKIFEDKDGVMQLICLNILNQILYNCNIQSNPERCKNLLSTNFMSMFEDKFFLDGQNEFIRSHWVSFLIKSLDYIAEIVNTDMFIRMASVILAKLCALIDITENKDHLLQGITSYLHYGLCISKPEAFNLPDLSSLSVVRESFFEGMFKRLLWTDSLPILSASSRISQEMFKEFTRILETCLVYIDDYDCEDIKAKGVSVFTSVKGKPIEDRIVKDLLEPIMVTRTYELVKAAIAVWISRSAAEVDPVPKTDQDLIKILRILTALDTPLDVIIEAIYKYLIEDLKINSGNTRKNSVLMRNQETSVAHFIYSLFSFYSKEKFEEICKESRLVWNEALRLLRTLDASEINVISLWVLEITYLLTKRVEIDNILYNDKNFAKGIRDLMQKLMNQVVGYCLINEERDIEYPFPPSAYETDKKSAPLTLCSLLTLKKTLYEISKVIWKDNPQKIASQLQYNTGLILKTLTNKSHNLDVDILTDLLYSLLESGGKRLASAYKEQIIDQIAGNDYFVLMRNRKICLKHWTQIIKLISYHCYEDSKEQLIKDILKRISKNNRSKIIKAVIFVVYSGDIDDYSAALNTISESLNEFLRIDKEFVNTAFFCIRVLLAKLSPYLLADVWPRVWPHTLNELLQILEQNQKISQCLSALKLIDMMVTMNINEFTIHQFMFFYDSTVIEDDNGDETDEFVPLIPRKFTRAPKTIKTMEVKESLGTLETRSLVMCQKCQDQTELDIKAKQLAREIVRLSQVRCVPDEKNIKDMLEADFLADIY